MKDENEDKYLSKYVRTYKNVDENWVCTIDENVDQSVYPRFVAIFEDNLTAEIHVRRCGTVKRAGEFLVDCIEDHYQRQVRRYTVPATEQLDAEDAIDSFTVKTANP